MKKNIAFIIGIALVVVCSAFSRRSITEWYLYDSDSDWYLVYINPNSYSYYNAAAPSSVGPNNRLQAIKVDPIMEVYPGDHPQYPFKPKVDVFLSSLQNDILNATGVNDGTINEISNRVLLKR